MFVFASTTTPTLALVATLQRESGRRRAVVVASAADGVYRAPLAEVDGLAAFASGACACDRAACDRQGVISRMRTGRRCRVRSQFTATAGRLNSRMRDSGSESRLRGRIARESVDIWTGRRLDRFGFALAHAVGGRQCVYALLSAHRVRTCRTGVPAAAAYARSARRCRRLTVVHFAIARTLWSEARARVPSAAALAPARPRPGARSFGIVREHVAATRDAGIHKRVHLPAPRNDSGLIPARATSQAKAPARLGPAGGTTRTGRGVRRGHRLPQAASAPRCRRHATSEKKGNRGGVSGNHALHSHGGLMGALMNWPVDYK